MMPLSKVKPYSQSAEIFSRSIYLAAMAGFLGWSTAFCIVYGFFQMIAVAFDSETGHSFALAAGVCAAGFGSASGFGIVAKAANLLAKVSEATEPPPQELR